MCFNGLHFGGNIDLSLRTDAIHDRRYPVPSSVRKVSRTSRYPYSHSRNRDKSLMVAVMASSWTISLDQTIGYESQTSFNSSIAHTTRLKSLTPHQHPPNRWSSGRYRWWNRWTSRHCRLRLRSATNIRSKRDSSGWKLVLKGLVDWKNTCCDDGRRYKMEVDVVWCCILVEVDVENGFCQDEGRKYFVKHLWLMAWKDRICRLYRSRWRQQLQRPWSESFWSEARRSEGSRS